MSECSLVCSHDRNPNDPNAPEYGKAYKMEHNSRPWQQAKGMTQEVGVSRTIRTKRARQDYI